MCFFFIYFTARATNASWLSWRKPSNFYALSALKFFFSILNVNSIGLYSGLYATLKIQRNSSSLMVFFVSSAVCELRLSMNKQIFYWEVDSRSSFKYSMNLTVLTDFG